MFEEPFESWKKKPSYTFGAHWLSRATLRRAFAEEVALRLAAQRETTTPLVALELERDDEDGSWPEGWHLFLNIEAFTMLDSFAALIAHVKSFLKRHDLAAGSWEMLLRDRAAPVRLSKAQRVALIDKTLKALSAHPFDKPGQEFLRIIEPFGDYALSLSIEYARFRHFMDGPFGAEDNPIHSLVGLACRVMGLPHDADEDTEPTLLAEGVLSLAGTTVRVADWEHTFDAEDEVFESVPYVEVNIAAKAPVYSFFFENLNPPQEEA